MKRDLYRIKKIFEW